jgi:hypothetical protein
MSFMESQIIESKETVQTWLTPLGQPVASRLLSWEQSQSDELLGDVFGYHAVQLGWPELQALRSNRMPHRWLAQAEFETSQPEAELGSAWTAELGLGQQTVWIWWCCRMP